jgi:hypothetical protein
MMIFMFLVSAAMISMAVKQMHQRAKEKNQIRQRAEQMRSVLRPKKECCDRGKSKKRQAGA